MYDSRNYNDGKCICKSNPLNNLPLKYKSELILNNICMSKRNDFKYRK